MFAFRIFWCASVAILHISNGEYASGGERISLDEVKFNIFDDKSDTFEAEVLQSLQTTNNFWADKNVENAINIGYGALNFIPAAAPFATLVPIARSMLAETSDWTTAFVKSFTTEGERKDALQKVVDIETTLETIETKMPLLNDTNPDLANRKSIATDFHSAFDKMLNYFKHTDSLFKNFPLIGSPPLISMSLLIASFQPIIKALNPQEAVTPQLACKVHDILLDYRERAVEDRLHKITVLNGTLRANFRDAVSHIRALPYNPTEYRDPYNSIIYNAVECRKNCWSNICLNDPYSKDQYDGINIYRLDTCAKSYAALVRHRVEEMYPVAFIEKFCDVKQTPTGFGFLTIKIRDITAVGLQNTNNRNDLGEATCEKNPWDKCDPYVLLFVNGNEVLKSGVRQDTDSYDAQITYNSKRIPKTAQIKIQVWDNDEMTLGILSTDPDLVQSEEGTIEDFMKRPVRLGSAYTGKGSNMIEAAFFWTDEKK